MSSGSESDEDYVPEEPQQLSEEESADEETEKQYENEVELKNKKRKIAQEAKGTKKRKLKKVPEPEPKEIEQKEEEKEVDPEEQKKREDDLWAMFLEGTDTKPKPKDPPKTESTESSNNPTVSSKPATSSKTEDTKKTDDAKERERRIFEFAGETIVVENNVIKEKIKTKESPGTALKLPRAGGGISSVLGQLNKKNQLSTLEKSKLDWQTFKKEEGIEEEIQSHNKGKNGYLEKRDFLERADYRQYEIERNLRLGRRSNR